MGRPIKKSYIGDISEAGSQITCYAWVPGDNQVRLCYINEQTGTGRYNVASTIGSYSGEVTLANLAPVDLLPGQASVSVTPYSGSVQYAEVIYDNTVRTFAKNQYKWYFSGIALTEVNAATIQSD